MRRSNFRRVLQGGLLAALLVVAAPSPEAQAAGGAAAFRPGVMFLPAPTIRPFQARAATNRVRIGSAHFNTDTGQSCSSCWTECEAHNTHCDSAGCKLRVCEWDCDCQDPRP